MAGRENQGLQISLIILVIITIMLSLSTYLFYRQADEKHKRAEAISDENATLQTVNTMLDSKVWHLKFMTGFGDVKQADLDALPTDEELAAWKKQYDEDMKVYGEGLPPESLNYRSLPENLIAAIRRANENYAKINDANKVLLEEKNNTITDEKKRTEEALKQLATVREEMLKERGAFGGERDRYKKEKSDDALRVATLSKNIVTIRDTAKVESDKLRKEVNTLDNLRLGLNSKLKELKTENFEIADGKITWVNQRAGLVWINLGSTDGLRPQTTFAVYEHNANGVANKKKKGRIEVTRLQGEHLAEARILEDRISDPFLPGDKIHTPAWQPGRRLRFALAGVLDVDNDGKDDHTLVKRIIKMNGGIVDAELKDDGTPVGQMSVNTRYLVRGEPPVSATGQTDANVLNAYTQMIGNGQKLNIEEISIDQFLNYMGWKNQIRTRPLGRRLGSGGPESAQDFEERTAPKKTPAPAGGRSAY